LNSFKKIQQSHGFTLIEIMVVVVIIGLMASFLVVSVAQDLDRLARLESQRFMAVVNEIRDEAIIAGEAFVMVVDKKSRTYSFNSLRENRSIAQDDGLFKVRAVKKGLDLDWDVFEQFEQETNDDSAPQVFISPLGEITPFDVRFGGEKLDYHVFINEENQLERRSERSNSL
jgi:general secretion pathway protein H